MTPDIVHLILSCIAFAVGWFVRHRQEPTAFRHLRDELAARDGRKQLRDLLDQLAEAPPGFEKR